MIVIDLLNAAVVKPLFSSGQTTNSTGGTAQDMNNAEISTNLILSCGTMTGDAPTVKAQESDDGSTSWGDITGASFAVSGGSGSNTVQVKRVLRTKRYIRGVIEGVTTTISLALLAVGQSKYVYDSTSGNSGVDKSPSS